MSYFGGSGNEGISIGRGTRRRKIAGYLRAANEVRQSYQNSRHSDTDDESYSVPGAFPGLKVAQNGTVEMVLFPSYAKQHIRKTEGRPSTGVGGDDLRRNAGPEDAEYWRKEWEIHEDANAIVDVDVRGWIYTPQKGPMNRKNRLVMGIARRLSGIPVPTQGSQTDDSSSGIGSARKHRHEEEVVDREAQYILQRGEREADVAGRGGYSEEPARVNSGLSSRSSSPRPGNLSHPVTQTSLDSAGSNRRADSPKWPQPADMSSEELAIANKHLLTRIKPFLSTAAVGMALTIFFFNDKTSQSRTTQTNESGHFNFRAALNFIPTDIRVLASESLSATDKVILTEPRGVSLISDIDDTVKHSGIGGRARDIFLNIFVRELDHLVIKGVSEWYQTMARLGVKIHYVSNSPWQMYPVLNSFFLKADLPPGSYHLKQYSGMFQGIFEPVAERKRGTIDRLMQDFPERRFILVGDSGEADLEVYTETALTNPGRILGIFIRDVTTTPKPNFFDTSMPSSRYGGSTPASNSGSATTDVDHKRADCHRPPLPPRPRTETTLPSSASDIGDLIDFSEDTEPEPIRRSGTDPLDASGAPLTKIPSNAPLRPTKPLALRSKSNELRTVNSNTSTGDDLAPLRSEAAGSNNDASVKRKVVPPPPPKPRKLSASQQQKSMDAERHSQSNGSSTENSAPRSTQAKIAAAYNALPTPNMPWSQHTTRQGRTSRRSSTTSNSSTDSDHRAGKSQGDASGKVPPPLPARRMLGGSPAPSMSSWRHSSPPGSPAPIDRRVDLWQRRWARAEAVLKPKGITLMTWRVGTDAQAAAEKLAKDAMKSLGNDS